MTLADDVREHHRRCAPHLATLRILAAEAHGAPNAAELVHQIERATGGVLSEAEAAQRQVVTALRDDERQSTVVRFLSARLIRLRTAADDVRAAAAKGDTPALRRRLWLFTSLTQAMWTVQASFCATSRTLRAMERASRR
jgi:hypothetical protein